MRRLALVLLAVCSPGIAWPQGLPPQEAAQGWIRLYDGESLTGWVAEGGVQFQSGSGGVLTASSGPAGWLRTSVPFADFVLKLEYRTGKDGNSGLFLRSAKEGKPHETGYELQIFNAHPEYPTGSLVNHIKATAVEPKPDTWHTYEITCEGDRFQVRLDGTTVLEGRDPKSRAGYIGLQYNVDKEIEFRNLKLKPLGLHDLFNGKDLTGWKRVDRDNVKEKPEWTARSGILHVEKGPGQFETESTHGNFVLQLDIRTNTKDPKLHPNSGVFLRGTPGAWWDGYESQIRNEFAEGDRDKPIDFGTGAIYRRVAARRIVANDNEFFTKTIVANGKHLSAWVNGYQVTDYEDPNPEGESVRKNQAVVKAGTISLQAHDPTTNLDFRNLKIADLPR